MPPIPREDTLISTEVLEEIPRSADAKIDVLTLDKADKAKKLLKKQSVTSSVKYTDVS